ncbi:MAG: DUF6056 family protein [Flavobacteriales bacterium]|nr:DUF6056 family protein [Flavobacteriales bacterium]MCW8912087.1 DUF6056 family protein [Flavobacteriales bacterium]MCW8936727.1 DUF6056 family protein [Flavobacteriales bacterium]MCW8939026.1 DUF6056 family protein [Flavobacteriales bacterium]MCW8967132.1 DUF6056 family protein [Flavobacteriales bacterium]
MPKYIRPYLIIQVLLWSCFFMSTAYFNRYAADDFYFLTEIKNKSAIEIFNHLQFEWHGRFASNLLIAFLMPLSKFSYFLITFNLSSYLLLYLAINRFTKNVARFYTITIENKCLFTFSLMSVCFFLTLSPNDVWFWFTGAVVYLYSTIALFFLLSVFFKKEKNSGDYFLLIISSVFISGSNEPMILILLLFLGMFAIKQHSHFKTYFPYLLSGVLLFLGFCVIFFGVGTALRDELTPSLEWTNVILFTAYATVKSLLFKLHYTFIPAILLAFPFYILGTKSKYKLENFQPIRQLVYAALLIVFIVIINHLIVVIPLGALPPDRATMISSVLILILLIRYLFLLGSKIDISEKMKKVILILNTIGVLIFVIVTFQIHKNYATAYDKRMDELAKIKINIIHQQPIYLKALPNSGYLPTAEIRTDTTHFLNVDLKRHFELNNALILEE